MELGSSSQNTVLLDGTINLTDLYEEHEQVSYRNLVFLLLKFNRGHLCLQFLSSPYTHVTMKTLGKLRAENRRLLTTMKFYNYVFNNPLHIIFFANR